MKKLILLTLSFLLTSSSWAALDFKGLNPAASKFSVDFSKSHIKFNENDNALLVKMKEAALDFCKIQKIQYDTLVLVLNPVSDLKGFDVFYTFLAIDPTGRQLNCHVVADMAFKSYSAGCDYTGKK